MRTRLRLLPILLVAVAMAVAVACGGDDSKAEKKGSESGSSASLPAGQASGSSSSSTSSSSNQQSSSSQSSSQQSSSSQSSGGGGRALSLDCGKDLKSFKFTGKFAVQSPQASGGSAADFSSILGGLLADMKFSGAFQAPDKTSFKLEGGKDSPIGTIEFIQIGNQQYTKFGPTGWQQSPVSSSDPTDSFDPREICTDIQKGLNADVPTKKEKVNGVDSTRYEYNQKALEKLGTDGIFGDLAGGIGGGLPENVKLNVWIADKEKFPVKMTMAASGTQDGQKYSFDMELNVTDLNGNVNITAPR